MVTCVKVGQDRNREWWIVGPDVCTGYDVWTDADGVPHGLRWEASVSHVDHYASVYLDRGMPVSALHRIRQYRNGHTVKPAA